MKATIVHLISIFCLAFTYSQGQGLSQTFRNFIKIQEKSPGEFKDFWQGLEAVFDENQKKTNQDLRKVDTLFVVFSRPDFLISGFEEVRIWNRTTDVRAYTAYKKEPHGKEKRVRKVVYGNKKVSDYPVLPEIDLIKFWIENKDSTSIYANTKKCQSLGGSRYLCVVAERKNNTYYILGFRFGNLCLKQSDSRFKLELQD